MLKLDPRLLLILAALGLTACGGRSPARRAAAPAPARTASTPPKPPVESITATVVGASDAPSESVPLSPAQLSPRLRTSIGRFYDTGRDWVDRLSPSLRFNSGVAMPKWFDSRVRFVVDRRDEFEVHPENAPLQSIRYYTPDALNPGDPNGRARVISSGIFDAVFNSRVPRIWTPSFGAEPLRITSAHHGIIQLKEEFVQALRAYPEPAAGLLGPIVLWAALLHEARHVDGVQRDRYLLHVRCPQTMVEVEVRGTADCDATDGRSYSVEADWYHWASANLVQLAGANRTIYSSRFTDIRRYLLQLERSARARILNPSVVETTTAYEHL